MNLHLDIMNIQVNKDIIANEIGNPRDYKLGHRDARHSAADLSLKADAYIERLEYYICKMAGDDILSEIKEECGV